MNGNEVWFRVDNKEKVEESKRRKRLEKKICGGCFVGLSFVEFSF